MNEIVMLANLARFIEIQLDGVTLKCEYDTLFESEIKQARLNLIKVSHHLNYAFAWSISKVSHEPSLPSIPGESVAIEQPVHGEG